MIKIKKVENVITSIDTDGSTLKTGIAGRDDTDIIQDAVRKNIEGGEIVLRSGKYRFSAPVEVDLPVTIRGEGRGTEIKPPAGDYAFKVFHSGRCTERAKVSFKTPPPQAEEGAGWDAILSEVDGKGYHLRLHGVQILDLAIDGDGQGKGIHLECLTESVLRDLWIMNTTDGAALHLGLEVMESIFENLHLSNCGSPDAEEATITIPSRNGNGCNNCHFRSIYVIFPRYIGIEIGGGDSDGLPRLLWFHDCMLHGWHMLCSPSPYDLIRVTQTNPERGIFISDCRIGMGQADADPENCHIRVCKGEVNVQNCVIGGGQSLRMLGAEPEASLTVRNNKFHGKISASLLEADRAKIFFAGNTVDLSEGENLLDISSPISARIINNDFRLSEGQRPLKLSDAANSPSGPVMVTGNFSTGSGENPCFELVSDSNFIARDNIF